MAKWRQRDAGRRPRGRSPEGRARGITLAAAVAAALVGGIGLSACGSSGSPNATTGAHGNAACPARPPAQAAVASMPMKVTHLAGSELVTVGVCIGSSGPYPFVLDTGTTRSIIDSSLASTLKLKSVAGQVPLGGSGCAITGQLVNLPALRMGGAVDLDAQPMVDESLADWSGESVDGVLGSDVLGRFSAVKFDLPKKQFTVLGAEGPAPTSHELLSGKSGSSPPASLLPAGAKSNVPVTVVEGPGTIAVYAYTDVESNGPPYAFVVDSGSPTSFVSTDLASTKSLAQKTTGATPGGVGCSGTVPVLGPTPFDVGSLTVTVPAARLVKVTGPQRAGIAGGLGIDFLGSSGTVVVDYADSNLAFATG